MRNANNHRSRLTLLLLGLFDAALSASSFITFLILFYYFIYHLFFHLIIIDFFITIVLIPYFVVASNGATTLPEVLILKF